MWKDWKIKVMFVYESYNGYDHTREGSIDVKARNSVEAFKLAKKRFSYPRMCYIKSMDVEGE